MKVEFSEKEMKEAAKIKKTVKELYKLQGIEDKEAEYHYELRLGSIGSTIYMVVPEFNIRVNITDYNKW